MRRPEIAQMWTPPTASSSTCRAIHYPDCDAGADPRMRAKVRSRRGREALDISGARTAR